MKKFFFDRRKEEENWKRERAIFLLFPTIFVPNTEQEAEKESVSLERRRNGRVGRAADSSSWRKERGKGRLAGGMTLINFSVWRTDFECSLMDSIPFEMETNQ